MNSVLVNPDNFLDLVMLDDLLKLDSIEYTGFRRLLVMREDEIGLAVSQLRIVP